METPATADYEKSGITGKRDEKMDVVASVDFGWWSIMPAVIAVVLALATRQVLPALFCGVWFGAWLLQGGDIAAIGTGLLRVLDTYILSALVPTDASTDHMSIVLFTLLTGAMIGVISRNGGMGGVVELITRFANTPKKGQMATSTLGIAVFFDDYANTLIVGNTMRPLLDKLRVSREKLAYLVDSTSAPLAATAMITTWIGFQVSLIAETMPKLEGLEMSAYGFMLSLIPYSFYSVLALLFVFMVVLTGRDFGPMLTAERTARATQPDTPAPKEDDLVVGNDLPRGNVWNAIIPIAVLIAGTVIGLLYTGNGESLADIFGSANSFKAMMWAALASLVTAVAMSLATRSLSLAQAMEALEQGLVPMLAAVVILTFAWAIAAVNAELKTADFVISMLGTELQPQWIPALVFIVAGITAFATGASWGTMAILIPLALPLMWTAMQANGIADAEHMPLMFAASASVLAGAVWGDHCSPISDTTVLSSLASRCNHIAHVRTQM
ncbi:MAG: Na+/H+ antiporter NhaC family protein, partial [Rickettsiales bacterium]